MIVHEFHGGLHDGLVLANEILYPVMVFPFDKPISNEVDYRGWTPYVGETVLVYALKGSPTETMIGGRRTMVHHLYLNEGTRVLRSRDTQP